MQKIIYTNQEIIPAASQLLATFSEPRLLCFHGYMGAGKTTLIKALVEESGGAEAGSSPTFGIANEYRYPDGRLLGYHFDFYRLENAEEALDLGLEDYLNQDAWIFVEWPEKVEGLLPEGRINVFMEVLDPTTRQLTIRA